MEDSNSDSNENKLTMLRPKGMMFPMMPLDENFDHLTDEEIKEMFDIVIIDLSE